MSDWLYLELFIVGCFLGFASGLASGVKVSKWTLHTIVLVLGAGVAAMLGALLVGSIAGRSPLFLLLFHIGKGSNLILAGVAVAGWICWKLRGRATDTGEPVFLVPSVLLGARLLMASYFAVTGVTALHFRERAYHFFQTSGYSYPFFMFIEIAECAGALGLLLPRMAQWAAIGLSLDMLGAIYTHFHNHLVWGAPNPFSNSLDALKILPVLVLIISAAARSAKEPWSLKERATA
jgi:uncharacterized membrane protein YphA (DoxX/SURF4 family)